MLDILVGALTGYLFGSIPTAYILVKRLYGIDLRTRGTRNVGALNTKRSTGSGKMGLIVALLDMAKGVVGMYAAWLACYYFGLVSTPLAPPPLWDSAPLGVYVAGFFAVLGHCYPVWLGFRGGKGLATAAGVVLVANPMLVILWLMVWFCAMVAWGMYALADLFSSALSPILAFLLGYEGPAFLLFVGVCAIVFIRFVPRIPSIVDGSEPVLFSFTTEKRARSKIKKHNKKARKKYLVGWYCWRVLSGIFSCSLSAPIFLVAFPRHISLGN